MAGTNLIHAIYIHGTAGTAIPTLPALNANYAQSVVSAAGWESIGSTLLQGADFGHDADLDSDTIEMGLEPVYEIIEAPRSLGPEDHIALRVPPKAFEFVCYDLRENIWALSSNITVSVHVARQKGATTKRAVMVEYEKLAVVWYPQCVVQCANESAGFADDGVGRLTVQVMPESTTAVPGGWRRYWKLAA